MIIKKCETYGIKYKHLIEHKYLCCNKNCQQHFDEKLKERFFNTQKSSNYDNKKIILLLQNVVYLYVYMDDWEEFNETPLPGKEDFYSHLNVEDIADAGYAHEKEFRRTLKQHLGEYHDSYVRSNAFLSAAIFEYFRNMCLAIYELDLGKLISGPGLAWQAALDLLTDLLTDIHILLMVEKGIRGGVCHSICRYAEANNKYMKDCDKKRIAISSILGCK